MSATDSGEAAFAPVLQAMTVMRTGSREEKKAAHAYLETFQKSVCWRLADQKYPAMALTDHAPLDRSMASRPQHPTIRRTR